MFNVSSRCQKLQTSSGILVSPVVSKKLLLRYSLHLIVDSIVVTPEHFWCNGKARGSRSPL